MIKLDPDIAPLRDGQKTSFSMISGQNDRLSGSIPVWSNFRGFVENIADPAKENSEKASFGVADVIDIVNPLHHIPIVSNLYQSATGDTISSVAQILGGGLFGGPVGALVSMGLVAYRSSQGNGQEGPQGSPQESVKEQNFTFLEGTTIALADLRQGYKPYNA